MCGRYALTANWPKIAERFFGGGRGDVEKARQFTDEWRPRFNAAPGQLLPVVIYENPEKPAASASPERKLKLLKWGLVPTWSKDPAIGYKTINARSETITEKASFKNAFRHRRCLVPADSFYEWRREGKVKQPIRILPRNVADPAQPGSAPLFAFAGIWENGTFTILTRAADAEIKKLHERMPVILDPEQESTWLQGSFDEAHALLSQAPAKRDWQHYAVSTRLNAATHDEPTLIQEEGPEQGSLL